MSERVQVVVGQFQLLEGDELPHPVRTGGGGVRVNVEPAGHGGLCLPGHRPELQQHNHTVTPWTDTHMLSTIYAGAEVGGRGVKMLIGPSCEGYYFIIKI